MPLHQNVSQSPSLAGGVLTTRVAGLTGNGGAEGTGAGACARDGDALGFTVPVETDLVAIFFGETKGLASAGARAAGARAGIGAGIGAEADA